MWATLEDVQARWLSARPFPERAVVEAWIDDAEAVIVFEYPDIQARIDDGDLAEANARMVVCQMVLRVLQNPENVRSRQQGIGAYSDGVTYAGDAPGGLWLTDEERAMLSGSSGTGQKAFTIDPTPAASVARELESAWVNGPLGSEPGIW